MSKPRVRAKKQHYVPRLHLKHFVGCQPKGMLWTYDMERGIARPSKPMETGAQNNFYSVKLDDGSYYDDLDKWLQDVENKATAGYERLLLGEIPEGQERADFATFVASLHLRSPSVVKSTADGFGRFVQMMLNAHWANRDLFERNLDQYERDVAPITISRDELWEFHNDPSRYSIKVDQQRGLVAIGASDTIQRMLFDREWHLVRAASDFFITSDSPVYRFVSQDQIHPFYGDGGFSNASAEISIPLTPNLLLLITNRDLPGPHLVLGADGVWQMNKMRAFSADRFLYADSRDDRITKIGAEFRDARMRMEIDGFGPQAEVEVINRMR